MSIQDEKANKKFTCSYQFDGCDWCCEVFASTAEEAEMKLRAMAGGKVDGEVIGEYRAEEICQRCGQYVPGEDVPHTDR